MDQFNHTHFRHIKIVGDQKSLSFDFDEKDFAELRPIYNHRTLLEDKENDIEILKDSWVRAELQTFFDHVEKSNIDQDYSRLMISFVEISRNLAYQCREIIDTQERKDDAFKSSLQQDISQKFPQFSLEQQISLTEKLMKILQFLVAKPNASAKEILQKTNYSREELKNIYKLIQCSTAAFQYLTKSSYFDYFHLASKFIAKNGFDLTFFVGRGCPYRCIFCRNVSVKEDGSRQIQHYPYKKRDLLQKNDICTTLNILKDFEAKGRPVAINISGGLEPLTDIERVDFILTEATRRNIRSTLYTNGFLFSTTAAVRAIALKSTRIRISLNAVKPKSFKDNTGRPEVEYDLVLQGIIQLVADKKKLAPNAHLALHAVVTPSIINEIPKLAVLASELGLDQVNYNPDYRATYTEIESHLIRTHIAEVNNMIASGHLGSLKLGLGGSLLRCNTFPIDQPDFDLRLISAYKVFVDPAGVVTPIHEGCYPRAVSTEEALTTPYSLGRLRDALNLLTILANDHDLPTRHFHEMNAFEMIVASELIRLQKDQEFGFEENPYQRIYDDGIYCSDDE